MWMIDFDFTPSDRSRCRRGPRATRTALRSLGLSREDDDIGARGETERIARAGDLVRLVHRATPVVLDGARSAAAGLRTFTDERDRLGARVDHIMGVRA